MEAAAAAARWQPQLCLLHLLTPSLKPLVSNGVHGLPVHLLTAGPVVEGVGELLAAGEMMKLGFKRVWRK